MKESRKDPNNGEQVRKLSHVSIFNVIELANSFLFRMFDQTLDKSIGRMFSRNIQTTNDRLFTEFFSKNLIQKQVH